MKHVGKVICVAMAASMALGTVFATSACNSEGETKNYEAMAYYDGIGESYNESLFRKNVGQVYLPDPAVMRITDENHPDYGYVYLYGTTKNFPCYKSKDLSYWETVSLNTLSDEVAQSGCFDNNNWAPEIIYDNGIYYMFGSATPSSKASDSGANGVLYVLWSESPSGPFQFLDRTAENRAQSYTDKDGVVIDCSDAVGQNSFFDMAKYYERVLELETVSGRDMYDVYSTNGYFSAIDPYAYIDDDGTRYLYYVFRSGRGDPTWLAGVECEEGWIPKYETISLLTYAGYNDIQGTQKCPYQIDSKIDEGPVMLKHNGMYYLTYSYGNAATDYQVGQAVGTDPLGTFRKLDESENGILLGDDATRFNLSGVGGQSILEIEGELYIIYHRHYVLGGGSKWDDRRVCVDKLEWVEIENSNGETMDVLYANGPTLNLQPNLPFVSDYKNIADRAQISAENMDSGSSASVLNDGLIAMNNFDNVAFNEKYIKEAYFSKTATITLSFEDYQTVRAIMIYNSKELSTAYQSIKRIEFDCLDENGNAVTNYIANLQMDWKTNRHTTNPESYRNAAAALAEFDEIRCKEIRITIEIPTKGWIIEEDGTLTYPEEEYMAFIHEKKVGISEIVVLGK